MEASAVPQQAPAGVRVFSSPSLLRLASDSHLVELIRQGRGAAFEAAYDRHHRAILSFCRHMLGDHDEAQDAVQHTFLAAYSDLISSSKPIHLRAWLFTIARNRCYSVLRSRREHPTAELSEAITEGLAAQVQRRQDLRDLIVDMQHLPEEQRAALVLAELEALSHEEIGHALGVPRDKVKALVFQARESLLASRSARETDCADIREQLATQRGGALRRSNLRRHLRECAGCREFRKQVERQRRQLAVVLPVAGTFALKEGALPIALGGAGAGMIGGGLLASSAVKGGITKLLFGLVAAAAGTAGGLFAASNLRFLTDTPARPLIQKQLVAPQAPIGAAAAGDRALAARSASGIGMVRAGALPAHALSASRARAIASARHRGRGGVARSHHRHFGSHHVAPRSLLAAAAPASVPAAVSQAAAGAARLSSGFIAPGHGRGNAYGHDHGAGHGRGRVLQPRAEAGARSVPAPIHLPHRGASGRHGNARGASGALGHAFGRNR